MPDMRLLSWLATREFLLMPEPQARALFGIRELLSNLITDTEGIKRFSLSTTWYGRLIYLHFTCIRFYLSFQQYSEAQQDHR